MELEFRMSGKYALEGWLAAGVIVVEKTTLLSEFKGNRPRSSQPDLRLVHRRVRGNCLTSERGASSSVVWRDSCQTPEREHDLVKPPPHPTIEPRSAMGHKQSGSASKTSRTRYSGALSNAVVAP